MDFFDARALAHYHAAYQDPQRIHAMCEDYRAGRTSDLNHDEADRAAGKKIGCPVLALWGAQGRKPFFGSHQGRLPSLRTSAFTTPGKTSHSRFAGHS